MHEDANPTPTITPTTGPNALPDKEQDVREQSVLFQMVFEGMDYREDKDFEMFGRETTIRFKPIHDEKFLPLLARMKKHLGIEIDADEDAVELTREEVEKARDKAGKINTDKLDENVVRELQEAAILGIAGSFDKDGAYLEHDEDDNRTLVNSIVGGYSAELGAMALEVTGSMRDAEAFR